MKKKFFRVAFVVLSLLLVSACAGCSQKDTNMSEKDIAPLSVKIAGGSSSGTMYMIVSGIMECMNRSFPETSVMPVPGGALANIYRVNNGEVNGALTHNLMAASALAGKPPFEKAQDNIAAVASFYPTGIQIVARQDLGVTSLGEIIDNKMAVSLSIDQPGSTVNVTFDRILAEYGVTVEDFESWGGKIFRHNMTDSASMLADGTIDGFCISTLHPAPPIQEASVSRDLVFISVDPEVSENLIQKYGYEELVVPKATYKFQDKDYTTIASRTVLVVAKDSPDKLAYQLAASLNQNLDYLKSVHTALANLTLEEMAADTGIPLHPGAAKYYKEHLQQ